MSCQFDMGPVAIKVLILDHVAPAFRTQTVLEAVKRLMLAVNALDYTPEKTSLVDFAAAILLDFPFWRSASISVISDLVLPLPLPLLLPDDRSAWSDRKSTRLNSSHT